MLARGTGTADGDDNEIIILQEFRSSGVQTILLLLDKQLCKQNIRLNF